jgi:hypothetical protein
MATTYTAPTTRATNDLITAAIWNTDMVDNIKHLKELHIVPEVDTDAGGSSTTSTSYQTTNLPSESVTTAETCDVIIIASIEANCSNKTYYGEFCAHRDATAVGIAVRVETEDKSIVCVVAVDENLAAGTYAFSIRARSEHGSGTITWDQASMVVIPIPTGS